MFKLDLIIVIHPKVKKSEAGSKAFQFRIPILQIYFYRKFYLG